MTTSKIVNNAEQALARLLENAGFGNYEAQQVIPLGMPYATTTPDFFFAQEEGEGVCIYLDGMSERAHGNPSTQEVDRQIRTELENRFYEVISIPVGDLVDSAAIQRHFYRLGKALSDNTAARRMREDTSWFARLLRGATRARGGTRGTSRIGPLG